jgi:hypothetical protein
MSLGVCRGGEFRVPSDEGRDGSGDPATSVQQSTKALIGEILCQMIAASSVHRRNPDLPIHVAILR